MKPSPKAVIAIAPASTTNGATVTGSIDTLGYDFVSIDVYQATSNNTTNKFSTCKISHSDTTDATNYSDITALVGGGAGGFTIPAADTSNPQLYKFNVDTKKTKRYLKVSLTPVTTQILAAFANLQIGEAEGTTSTDVNTNLLVNY